MSLPVYDLDKLIASMDPVLNPGVFVFVSVQNEGILRSINTIASIRETEGFSAVISESDAALLGLPVLFRVAWITLNVNSALQAIGFTAAFSSVLGAEGISCNVVAGAYHDHLFVPVDRAGDAMHILRQLRKSAKTKKYYGAVK